MIEASPSRTAAPVIVLKDNHSPEKGGEKEEDWAKLQEAFRMR
jgi:hypothetical protein